MSLRGEIVDYLIVYNNTIEMFSNSDMQYQIVHNPKFKKYFLNLFINTSLKTIKLLPDYILKPYLHLFSKLEKEDKQYGKEEKIIKEKSQEYINYIYDTIKNKLS